MPEGEKPLETTKLGAIIADGKGIIERMNEINDLYEFGRSAPEGGERTPVGQEEGEKLEEQWDALNNDLAKVCADIVREQGGQDALTTVDILTRNLRCHITGDTYGSTKNKLKILEKIVVELSRK
ncbi:MAG: hypothetical protein Q8P56_05560 [Candidatus Uhrbacteria bacterium]|nr:hypothetical protein [Candidatus Uhrbacteria bacterium]